MVDVTVYELESYLTKGEFKADHWDALSLWKAFLQWEQDYPGFVDRAQLGVKYYGPTPYYRWEDDQYVEVEDLVEKAQAAQEKLEKVAEVKRLVGLVKKKRVELEIVKYDHSPRVRDWVPTKVPAWAINIDGQYTGLCAVSRNFRNYYDVWTDNGYRLTSDHSVQGLNQALLFVALMWQVYKGWATVSEDNLTEADKEAVKRELAFWRDTLSKS